MICTDTHDATDALVTKVVSEPDDDRGTESFAYDDWGRMVTKTDGTHEASYGYRFARLKHITSDYPDEAGETYYLYDGFGKWRFKQVDGGNFEWYRWAGSALVNVDVATSIWSISGNVSWAVHGSGDIS